MARTLGLFLPESPFYSTLSELPPPDATSPTATTTFFAQTAIHDSLPLLEEIVSIHEKDEENNYNREVDARRKRLDAAGPEEVRKEVVREIWSVSKVIRNPYTPLIITNFGYPSASEIIPRNHKSSKYIG